MNDDSPKRSSAFLHSYGFCMLVVQRILHVINNTKYEANLVMQREQQRQTENCRNIIY